MVPAVLRPMAVSQADRMTKAATGYMDRDHHMSRGGGWLPALRAYILVSVAAHFLWEIGHLPFYTLWTEGTFAEKAFAIVHCTAGDAIIAVVTLIAALALLANRHWPAQRFQMVGAATIFFGIGYTVFSEWTNVAIRKSWAYSDLMPTLPPIGTGLTPLLQWLIVPALALFAANRAAQSNSR